MTTFSYPPAMAHHDFELFATSQEQFADFPLSTAPAYMGTSASFDIPFTDALSTIDSFGSIQAYSTTQPQSQEQFRYVHDAAPPHAMKDVRHAYSPSGSPSHSSNFEMPPPHLSTSSESGASVQSTSSSAIGSPSMHPQLHEQQMWNAPVNGLGFAPGIVQHDHFGAEPFTTSFEQEPIIANDKLSGFVDPNLINSFPSPIPMQPSAYPEITTTSPRIPFYEHPPSPAPSNHSQTHQDSRRFRPAGSQSPYLQTHQWAPYPQYQGSRRPSVSSTHSKHSQRSNRSASGSFDLDEEGREKGLCPIPECGRVFKDLKAHMLTHLLERPEKCPIATCEYHVKGFARKYDKNRHTLTHYKGTMVCGFCPGSGSAAEKSFNRADVFKRHLTSVHGVEQTAPNSRKRSPSGNKKASSSAAQNTSAGTCSTCSVTFANAQEFYEHLDDCVLRVVQQTDPSEAINQKHLTSVADDKKVQDTLDKHHLPSTVDYTAPEYNEQEDDEEDEEFDNDDTNDQSYGSNPRAGRGNIKNRKC